MDARAITRASGPSYLFYHVKRRDPCTNRLSGANISCMSLLEQLPGWHLQLYRENYLKDAIPVITYRKIQPYI